MQDNFRAAAWRTSTAGKVSRRHFFVGRGLWALCGADPRGEPSDKHSGQCERCLRYALERGYISEGDAA